MGRYRFALALMVVATLVGASLAQTPRVRAAEACFAETGHCVQGSFLAYWQEHGGLAINGFPLSDERVETLEDGRVYTVQYFERVRMEYHPENAGTPYAVLLGQFGRRVFRERVRFFQGETNPALPQPGAAFFPETGHNLAGRFLTYWEVNGGLAQFGYPITEEGREQLTVAPSATVVQYFERARFEYHPENAGGEYEVLLGQFGRDIAAQADRLTGDFGFLYITNEGVRARLGPPSGSVARAQGAAQEFERGRMFYRGDLRHIYALRGGPQAGDLVADPQLNPYFVDTWAEGQDAGGGSAPQPGLYLPRRGFGKVWREHGYVQGYLGYALASEEMGYNAQVQDFARGVMLSSPDGRYIWVLTLRETRECDTCGTPELRGSYERFERSSR